jgi:hypothetical protein
VSKLRDRRPEFIPGRGRDPFSLRHRVQTASGAHPASYPVGTGEFFPGVKGTGREADHSSPSSAEVMNAWGITPFPHTFSWRGKYLSTGITITLPLPSAFLLIVYLLSLCISFHVCILLTHLYPCFSTVCS